MQANSAPYYYYYLHEPVLLPQNEPNYYPPIRTPFKLEEVLEPFSKIVEACKRSQFLNISKANYRFNQVDSKLAPKGSDLKKQEIRSPSQNFLSQKQNKDSLKDSNDSGNSNSDGENYSERDQPTKQLINTSIKNIHDKTSTEDEKANFAKEKLSSIWDTILPESTNKTQGYKYGHFS